MKAPSPYVAAGALVLLLLCACDSDDARSPASRPSREESSSGDLADAVRIEGIEEHLEALDAVARAAGGSRAAGGPGYERSVEYVTGRLEAAGYNVDLHRFSVPVFAVPRPSTLRVGSTRLVDGDDFRPLIYGAAGVVRGRLDAVGFDADATGRTGPACDPANLTAVEPGTVVLLRPGPCFSRDQVVNAQSAGAAAVLISYPEFVDEPLRPTLLDPSGIRVPAFGLTDDAGRRLAALDGAEVRLSAHVVIEERELANVIATAPGNAGDEIVIIGGHLDSVLDGPGLNDNGSGVAAILELAEELAGKPRDRGLRVGFWAGEELGLLGSTAYVDGLDDDERRAIAAYLNFDMLGSPNGAPLVYSPAGMPPGSRALTELFSDAVRGVGLTPTRIELGGASDHAPFARAGIPVGGLFSGADEIKPEAIAERSGGRLNEPFDPCYHLECDDLGNVDRSLLDRMADAAAAVVEELAVRGFEL